MATPVQRTRPRLERLEPRTLLNAQCDATRQAEVCVELPGGLAVYPALAPLPTETVGLTSAPSTVVPPLSSLPGAATTLYLDFDGHFEAVWGDYRGITTPAFDTDGRPGSFSAAEQSAIEAIWRYISEDFAPLDLNVTTLAPASFADGVALRVVLGGNGAWYGRAGGVAYLDSFTNDYANTVFVFSGLLGNGNVRYVADAATHEAGHAFGLEHQSLWRGGGRIEYQGGPGDGTAPIMGYPYEANRALWWHGTTTSPGTYQDDLAVLTRPVNGFGHRDDDHGDSADRATVLAAAGIGSVGGAGVIERMSDVDVFALSARGGALTATAAVPQPYNNLDVRLELRDAAGRLLGTADPAGDGEATLRATVTAGTYYLFVRSAGLSPAATASNHGHNVGQYTLTATVPLDVDLPAAPTDLNVRAISATQVVLTWSDRSSDEIGFRIERLDAGVWRQVAVVAANVVTWQDNGRPPATSCTYRVRAYNGAGVSEASPAASVLTPAGQAPLAPGYVLGWWSSLPRRRVVLYWTDRSRTEQGFLIERSSDGGSTWSSLARVGRNVTRFNDLQVRGPGTYLYRVRAFNASGVSAPTGHAVVFVPGAGLPPLLLGNLRRRVSLHFGHALPPRADPDVPAQTIDPRQVWPG